MGAKVIIKMKVMPESPETNLTNVQDQIKQILNKYDAKGEQFQIEPIAFGLHAIIINFLIDEDNESTDPIEQDISNIEDVRGVEITGVSRALG